MGKRKERESWKLKTKKRGGGGERDKQAKEGDGKTRIYVIWKTEKDTVRSAYSAPGKDVWNILVSRTSLAGRCKIGVKAYTVHIQTVARSKHWGERERERESICQRPKDPVAPPLVFLIVLYFFSPSRLFVNPASFHPSLRPLRQSVICLAAARPTAANPQIRKQHHLQTAPAPATATATAPATTTCSSSGSLRLQSTRKRSGGKVLALPFLLILSAYSSVPCRPGRNTHARTTTPPKKRAHGYPPSHPCSFSPIFSFSTLAPPPPPRLSPVPFFFCLPNHT